MEHDVPCGIYNVAAGKAFSVQWILDQLIDIAREKISVKIDDARYRPTDIEYFCGSNEKIQQVTGWKPQYDIHQGLEETYKYWLGRGNS